MQVFSRHPFCNGPIKMPFSRVFQTAPIRTSVTMAEHVFQLTVKQTTTVTVPPAGMETVASLLVRHFS